MRFYRVLRNRTLLLFVPTALALALIGLSAHIDGEWERMKATGLELECRVQSELEGPRPTFHADPIEGNAWAEYETAFAVVPSDSMRAWVAYREAVEAGERDEAERDALIEAHAPALDALLRGARHTRGAQPIDWENGLGNRIPKLMPPRELMNMALVAARKSAEEGEMERATDLYLASLQLGGDLQRSPWTISGMTGVSLFGIARNGLIQKPGPEVESLLNLLTLEQLERVSLALEELEESLPHGLTFLDGEQALLVRELQKLHGRDQILGFDTGAFAWTHPRFFFSPRLAWASSVNEAAHWADVHRGAFGSGWAECLVALQQEQRAAEEGTNPIQKSFARGRESITRSYFAGLLNLRLARMAVDHRLGRMRVLADPFGGELQVTESAETLSIVSAGPFEGELLEFYTIELPADPTSATSGG